MDHDGPLVHDHIRADEIVVLRARSSAAKDSREDRQLLGQDDVDDAILWDRTLRLENQSVHRVNTRGDIVGDGGTFAVNAARCGRVGASGPAIIDHITFKEGLNLDVAGRLSRERVLKLLEGQLESERFRDWIITAEDVLHPDDIARHHGVRGDLEVIFGVALRSNLNL